MATNHDDTDGVPECDYGCGRPAHFKNFPQNIHGRLYEGPTCEYCATYGDGLVANVETLDDALEALKDAFPNGSIEQKDLESMKGREFETYE